MPDPTLRAVLFDLDGTLVDQQSAAAEAVVEWAAEHGITGLTPSDVLMVGDSLENDVRGALAVGIDAVLLDRYDVHADAGVRRIRSLHELQGPDVTKPGRAVS